MRKAGPIREYRTDDLPLVTLIKDLGKFDTCNAIQVSKPGFSLTLRKAPPGS